MRIVCVGGGPGGLYAALLLKQSHPNWLVEVYERNERDSTYGWGIVFSDQTMSYLADADRKTHDAIVDNFYHWDDIEVYFKDNVIRSSGHGFSGLGRMEMLKLLHNRCEELGVKLHFGQNIKDESSFVDADLIIAADGVGSFLRTKYEEFFHPTIIFRKCRFRKSVV